MRCLAAITVAGALLATPALGAVSHARLTLADSAPLTVTGAGFRAGERVKIVVSGSVALSRIVRAGTRGGFTATFKANLDRCDPLLVRATGTGGSRAKLDLTQIACAPAP